jgi:hypothetical protein
MGATNRLIDRILILNPKPKNRTLDRSDKILKTRNSRIFNAMTSSLNTERLDEALSLLSERLRLVAAEPQELVVCGGSSLIARGYVSRVTCDVDVLARRCAEQAWSALVRFLVSCWMPQTVSRLI